jgi:hypothetical protein
LRSGWWPIVFFFRAVRRPSLSFLSSSTVFPWILELSFI